jgi:hypothetical protein
MTILYRYARPNPDDRVHISISYYSQPEDAIPNSTPQIIIVPYRKINGYKYPY